MKYEPFKADDVSMFLDTESVCQAKDDDITSLSLDELYNLRDELKAAIEDWETIIDIQLYESPFSFDQEQLANDRRHAQKTREEYKAVKARIKELRKLQNAA